MTRSHGLKYRPLELVQKLLFAAACSCTGLDLLDRSDSVAQGMTWVDEEPPLFWSRVSDLR